MVKSSRLSRVCWSPPRHDQPVAAAGVGDAAVPSYRHKSYAITMAQKLAPGTKLVLDDSPTDCSRTARGSAQRQAPRPFQPS